jgi:hypothetical protein
VQALSEALAAFGDSEGKMPAEWKEFFTICATLEQQGKFEALSVALLKVLKGIVWSEDICAQKAALTEGGPHADCTMFIRNWGAYASEIARLNSGVQQRAEAITAELCQARDKMRCFKRSTGKCKNHLDSMCYVNNGRKRFRGDYNTKEEEEWYPSHRNDKAFRDGGRGYNRDRYHRSRDRFGGK